MKNAGSGKPRKRGVLRSVGRAAAAVLGVGFAYLAYVYLTLPDVRALKTTNPGPTAFMQLRERQAHAQGKPYTPEQRWVPYSRISNNLKRAVIVTEDSAFWQHEGVDYEQLRESMETNWERGEFARGASTITQQLAKNLYLSPSRNPVRKLKELLITRRLEAALSKRRILEIYLNVIEWGDGIFGAEAAARAYFGKPAAALAPDEAALLAGAIINPRAHNPAKPTKRLLRRQQIIARRMGIKAAPSAGPVIQHTPAADPPQSGDASSEFPSINQSSPAPPPPAQTVQPLSGNGSPPPLSPTKPSGSF